MTIEQPNGNGISASVYPLARALQPTPKVFTSTLAGRLKTQLMVESSLLRVKTIAFASVG